MLHEKFFLPKVYNFVWLSLILYFYDSFVIFVSYKGKNKIYVVAWFSLNIPQISIILYWKSLLMENILCLKLLFEITSVSAKSSNRKASWGVVKLTWSEVLNVFGTSATPPPILEPLEEIFPKMQQSPSRKMLYVHTNNIT